MATSVTGDSGKLTMEERESVASGSDRSKDPAAASLPILIAVICVAVFLLSIDRNIVAVATPQITDQFHSYSDVGWYGSAYMITICALQPVFGRIYTEFNIKWTYIAAFGIFEVGSLVCGVAPSSRALIVGRAIAGCGAAGVLSGSYVIVAQTVPLKSRPVYIAGVSMLFSLGAILAPLIGGGFTTNVTWRWCFYLNLPVGLPAMAAMAYLFNPPRTLSSNTTRSESNSVSILLDRIWSLDLLGAALLLGAAITLFLALQFASEAYSWGSPRVAGLTTGAAVTFLVLLLWTAVRGERALVPPRILSQRTVLASAAAAVALYGALTTHVYYLPIYFQAIRDASPIGSAVDLLPLIVATSVFSIVAGVLATVTGLFTPFAIVGSAMGVAGASLLITLGETTSTANWAGFQILVGIGYGLAVQQGFFAVQAVLSEADTPIGTSLITFCQSLGGALGVSIGVDIDHVIAAGATSFRDKISGNALDVLLSTYVDSLRRVFILATVFVGISLLTSPLMGAKRISKTQTNEKTEKTDIEGNP